MNSHQIEAIANANAHLNNACLPTYDEIVSALGKAVRLALPSADVDGEKGEAYSHVMNVLASAKNEKFVIVNADGRFYTSAGNAKWSFDEALAQVYDCHSQASTIASLECGTVVNSSEDSRSFFKVAPALVAA